MAGYVTAVMEAAVFYSKAISTFLKKHALPSIYAKVGYLYAGLGNFYPFLLA
jgi:hypothetical protein